MLESNSNSVHNCNDQIIHHDLHHLIRSSNIMILCIHTTERLRFVGCIVKRTIVLPQPETSIVVEDIIRDFYTVTYLCLLSSNVLFLDCANMSNSSSWSAALAVSGEGATSDNNERNVVNFLLSEQWTSGEEWVKNIDPEEADKWPTEDVDGFVSQGSH